MPSRVAPTRLAAAPATPAAESAAPLRALPAPGAPARVFRIHHRSRPPYPWSLELSGPDGVLAVALPRGLPWAEGETRPAQPGAREEEPAPLWDEGDYRVVQLDERRATLHLEGRRVRGRYALEERAGWVLRRLDPASMRPMPERVLPMLAHRSSYPSDPENYAFEEKWDGIRALAHVHDGRVTLRSRNLSNVTSQYPELQGLAEALGETQAVLDGEIVALDASGRPSFQLLQGRFGVSARSTAQAKTQEAPVVYMVFDLLYLDGHDLTSLPYEERRRRLVNLPLDGPRWRVSPARIGDGRAILADPRAEGVVAKRLGSPYEPGARSRAWLKIKEQRRQEFVIGGYTPGRGAREGRIGALLVGYYDATPDEARRRGVPQRFRFAGSVGTGFTSTVLRGLERLLEADRVERSPFADDVEKPGAVFVEPRYVAEVEFTEWTREGRLRHPSFKGLREDKDARTVVREEA